MPPREPDRRPTDSPSVAFSFVRAALCPTHFRATPLGRRDEFRQMNDDNHHDHAWTGAMAKLSVGDSLVYPRQFPYRDQARRRRIGTHVVTAAFGLAPHDVDLLLAIRGRPIYGDCTVSMRFPSTIGTFGRRTFLGKLSGQSVTSSSDYLAIRSRVFRLAYTAYLNTLRWNGDVGEHEPQQFQFFNIEGGMSQITESKRPMEIRINPTFLDLVCSGHWLSDDELALYLSLGRNHGLKRWLLTALLPDNRRACSSPYLPDEFAVQQLGMNDGDNNVRLRRARLKKRAAEACDLGFVRPVRGANDLFRTAESGALRGEQVVQWQAGPAVRSLNRSSSSSAQQEMDQDPLWCQVRHITDEDGRGVTAALYRCWLAKYGRALLQKHAPVVLAQMERNDPPLTKSAAAALVHYMQKDYELPSWYLRERQRKRLAEFDKLQPNQLSLEVLGMIVR